MADQANGEDNVLKLDWLDVDLSKMPVEASKAYEEVRAAFKVVKDKKDALRKITDLSYKARKLIPAGHEPVYSFKYGKLKVALAPEGQAKSGKRKATKSL